VRVINLWAGPGAGKSTTAAGLFHLFKVNDHRVELVTEYAKDLVYEQRTLDDQLMILAQQNRRLRRLVGTVDWVITDSPIPLTLAYTKPPFDEPWFYDAVTAIFGQYDNWNVVIKRSKAFQSYGRVHGEEESSALDEKITDLARKITKRGLLHCDGDRDAPLNLYQALTQLSELEPLVQQLMLRR
jgi:hypothetical protein